MILFERMNCPWANILSHEVWTLDSNDLKDNGNCATVSFTYYIYSVVYPGLGSNSDVFDASSVPFNHIIKLGHVGNIAATWPCTAQNFQGVRRNFINRNKITIFILQVRGCLFLFFWDSFGELSLLLFFIFCLCSLCFCRIWLLFDNLSSVRGLPNPWPPCSFGA